MAGPRRPASDITVFNVGGTDMLTAFKNGTITFETKDEDGSGAKDVDEYPVVTKRRSHLEVDAFVENIAALMPYVGQDVTVIFSTGGGTYSALAVVSMGQHTVHDGQLQMEKVTFKTKGVVSLS